MLGVFATVGMECVVGVWEWCGMVRVDVRLSACVGVRVCDGG